MMNLKFGTIDLIKTDNVDFRLSRGESNWEVVMDSTNHRTLH